MCLSVFSSNECDPQELVLCEMGKPCGPPRTAGTGLACLAPHKTLRVYAIRFRIFESGARGVKDMLVYHVSEGMHEYMTEFTREGDREALSYLPIPRTTVVNGLRWKSDTTLRAR